jgi:predicted Rdx family selenoprotein
MVDPITALAAISSAVELVKKVAATVDDVTSLGPVLGKYFDAKADAIEVVQKSQEGGFKGSALGKALELEMAIEQAKQFEATSQVKALRAPAKLLSGPMCCFRLREERLKTQQSIFMGCLKDSALSLTE